MALVNIVGTRDNSRLRLQSSGADCWHQRHYSSLCQLPALEKGCFRMLRLILILSLTNSLTNLTITLTLLTLTTITMLHRE